MQLASAYLAHNRIRFEVMLTCDDGNTVKHSVQVAPGDVPLLVPYLVLLHDSQAHPLHTERPVVPVMRNAAGRWVFCGDTARRDQEPIPPEPVLLSLNSTPR